MDGLRVDREPALRSLYCLCGHPEVSFALMDESGSILGRMIWEVA